MRPPAFLSSDNIKGVRCIARTVLYGRYGERTAKRVMSATTMIAALALVLGVFNLLLGAFNSYVIWRDRNPRLKIDGSVGVVPDFSDETLYTITLSNPGEKAVSVTSIRFGINGGQALLYGSMVGFGPTPGTLTPLPHKIEPGDSAAFWVELERLQDDLRRQGYSGDARVTVQAGDAVGKKHKKRVKIGLGQGDRSAVTQNAGGGDGAG